MSKFLSGRQSNLKLGVSGYTENQTVLQTTGKVGIGTTDAQQYSLYVVGDTNITDTLTVNGINITGPSTITANVNYADDIVVSWGDSEDLKIYHDSNGQSYIKDTGTGDLNLTSDGSGIHLQSGGGETLARFYTDGPALLYYDGQQRLSTSGLGVTITGALDLNGNLDVAGISTFTGLIDANGGIDATSVKVEDLTNDRIVIAGVGGELEDSPNLTFDGNTLNVVGNTELDNLNVSGIATVAGNTDLNGNLDVDGTTELDSLNVDGSTTLDNTTIDGILTVNGDIDLNGDIDVDGHTELDQLRVVGVSTFAGNVDISSSGNLTVAGNLIVQGTETILNTTALEVEDINIGIASADPKLSNAALDGAGITIYGSAGDKTLTWSNANSRMEFNTELYAPRYVGAATNNVIPFLYNNPGDLPNPGSYHGAFAHVHLTGKAYYAHSNAWWELVNKELDGTVGTGTERYNIGNTEITNVQISGIASVGAAITMYGSTGIISATAFYGDGSNLLNTGATLGATSGTERLVTTQLTSGTMVNAATDADLTYNATTDLLSTPNIAISGGISTDGASTGGYQQLLRADGSGGWEWATVPGIFSVNNILNGFIVQEEGVVVGTAGSITTLDFRGINVTANADPQPNGIATITFSDTPTFDELTVTGLTTTNDLYVSGISTFVGVGTFLGDLYVGGDLYVQDDIVFDSFTANSFTVSGIATFNGPISAGSSVGSNGQYLQSTGVGVTWASFPTLRVVGINTAIAGQTTFNFSYNVDFLDVFVNGVKLSPSEYTATNGNQVVLNTPAFADEIVEFHSYNVTSTYSGGGGGGGGGASNLDGLTDVTIGTLADKQLLQYQSSSGEWENVNISSAGVVTSIVTNTSDVVSISDSNGIVTLDVAVGAGGTWAVDSVGINTVKNVGIGTTAKDGYKLYVEGDARVTGILTVGPASVTIDGINNTVTANSFVGSVSGSGNSVSCTTVSVGGSVTANQLFGDGSNLTGLVTSLIGKANVTIGDNPPGIGTASGDLWWESDTAKGHIYYDDGSSAQWVEFSPSSGGGGGGGGGGSYANSDVDNHLNVASASAGEILSWNGSDYDWVVQGSGNINADTLNVSGLSTFIGITTQKSTLFANQLNVAGISTFNADVHFLDNISANFGTQGSETDVYHTGNTFYISNVTNTSSNAILNFEQSITLGTNGGSGLYLFTDGSNVSKAEVQYTEDNTLGDANTGAFQVDGGVGIAKNLTVGAGLTVTSGTFLSSVNVSGIITAASFSGITTSMISDYGNGLGGGGISNVVEDTTPQLGGNLDLNGSNITGNGNISINGTASITGSSIQLIDNNNNDTYIKMTSGITSISHPAQSVYPQRIATTNQGIDIFKDVSIKDTNNTEKFNFNTGSGTLTADFFSGDGSNLTNVSAGATDLVSTYNLLNTATTNAYFVDGPGITDTTDPNPTIYLTRGQTYKFNNNAGAHPFRIQYQYKTISGAIAYNDGIPNNQVGNGATLYWEVPFDAPDVLYYQCSSHINMSGKIVIMGDVISEGSWTATSNTLTNIDTITGIANNAIKTAEYTIHIQHSTGMQSQKVLVMQDGSEAYSQEYAIMNTTSNPLVSIGASVHGGNLYLNATPSTGVNGITTYTFTRQTIR